MGILEMNEQVLDSAAKVTFDLPVSTFIFVLLKFVFNSFMSAAGISIPARYLQFQICDDPGQVLAHTIVS